MLLKIPIRLQFLVFSLLDFELQFCTCSWQSGVGRASRARVIGSETRLCCEIDCVFGVFSLFKSKQICVISDKLFLRFRYLSLVIGVRFGNVTLFHMKPISFIKTKQVTKYIIKYIKFVTGILNILLGNMKRMNN